MADVTAKISPEDMTNSEGFNLRDVIQRNKSAQDEQLKRERLKESIDKIEGLRHEVYSTTGSNSDRLRVLSDALVPDSGKADTVAGELVRAMNRILYRDYNDGDVFYMDYGLETCASSVMYIIWEIPQLEEEFSSIAESRLIEGAYTQAIENIAGAVIDYIFDNVEEVANPADKDSRMGKWDISDVVEWAGTEDYVSSYPYDIEKFIELGVIDSSDVASRLQEWLDYDWGSTYDTSASVWAGVSEYEISGLTPTTYRVVDEQSYEWLSAWAEELIDQYGDPSNL